jgi:uncharacterized Zn finger protein
VAAELDRDPFLLFELRGLSRAALHQELVKSPLGMALSAELATQKALPTPSDRLYTQPQTTVPAPVTTLRDFWHGAKRLPALPEPPPQPPVPAILVKKQGDFPPFWHKDGSFIEVMEEFYQRVRTKSREVL